jgi:hypothetical protein
LRRRVSAAEGSKEGEGDVQGCEHVASDAVEVGCNERISVAIARLRKTRTLIHDAKHRYQVLVLVQRDSLDESADVVEHAPPLCVAHDAVEEVDLSELARVAIAWRKCG